jgi:hypothetical protein
MPTTLQQMAVRSLPGPRYAQARSSAAAEAAGVAGAASGEHIMVCDELQVVRHGCVVLLVCVFYHKRSTAAVAAGWHGWQAQTIACIYVQLADGSSRLFEPKKSAAQQRRGQGWQGGGQAVSTPWYVMKCM